MRQRLIACLIFDTKSGARLDTGFGVNHLYSACRLSVTHYYEGVEQSTEPIFGTGFLVEFPNEDNRFGVVTNRHLTDVPWHKPLLAGLVIKSVKIEIWQSNKLKIEFTINDPTPLYHNDQTIDIAVIPFDREIDPKTMLTPYDTLENIVPDPNTSVLMFHHGLSWPYLLECESLWPVLEPGEFVSFPGYPAWYDKLQTRPVLRSGMIASDPQTEYRRLEGEATIKDGNQQILFDAFSTSGNSGSPVFVASRGIPPLPIHMVGEDGKFSPHGPAAKLEVTGYHRSFLIGINAGHINDPDSERDNDHAGLSRMHNLPPIMELLRASEAAPQAPQNTRLIVQLPDADGGQAGSGDSAGTD